MQNQNQVAAAASDLNCPECQQNGTVNSFPDPKSLGRHRRFAHGIPGKSRTALLRKKQQKNIMQLPQPKEPEAESTASPDVEFPAEMIGYTMGKLESLAESIARENGFSVNRFVPLVAMYFAQIANNR